MAPAASLRPVNVPAPKIAHPYARSHARLLARLAREGVEPRVLEAFAEVPRHWFVSEALALAAYRDDALPIGAGQTTSRPSTIARMLMLLGLTGRERVLEIGAGSGFLTALLARLAARVYAIERVEALAQAARRRLVRARCFNATVRTGDGARGLPGHAPFDAIVAAAAGHPPPAWIAQLREDGGVLVFPMPEEGGAARLARWIRRGDEVQRELWDPCRFVPLVQGGA